MLSVKGDGYPSLCYPSISTHQSLLLSIDLASNDRSMDLHTWVRIDAARKTQRSGCLRMAPAKPICAVEIYEKRARFQSTSRGAIAEDAAERALSESGPARGAVFGGENGSARPPLKMSELKMSEKVSPAWAWAG